MLRRLVLLGAALFHFGVILKNSVNIPFMDEWDALPRPSVEWLWRPHNEHRIFLTKLESLGFYFLNRWDLRWQVAGNFLLFLGLLALLWSLLKEAAPEFRGWPKTLSFLVLLSPLLQQNHHWAFQSQFHFFLLFGLLAARSLFFTPRPYAAALWVGLSIFSFGAGLPFCAGILCVWALKEGRKRRFRELFLVGVACLGVYALWFVGYHPPPAAHPRVGPTAGFFWIFLSNLVSLGFGILGRSFLLGALASLFVLLTMVRSIRQRRPLLTALVLAVCFSLALITSGRAGFGIDSSKSSRYAEIALLLTPLSLAILARDSRRLTLILSLVIFAVSLGHSHLWRQYEIMAQGKREGRRCLESILQGQNPEELCGSIYPGPLGPRLKEARALGLSFTRGLNQPEN